MAATQGWHRVDPDDLPADGRVRAVTVGGHVVALARCGGQLGALDNRCPHQGGPWVRGPSRAAGCVVRGMATTTTRSPAHHLLDSPMRPAPTRYMKIPTASMWRCRNGGHPARRSPT